MTDYSSKTVYLVTGVSRGIGASFLELLSKKSNSFVIGAVRNIEDKNLQSIVAKSNNILLVRIDSEDDQSPFEAAKQIKAKGIQKIDWVIANAGLAGSMTLAAELPSESLRKLVQVNTIAPLLLFQAFKPFLKQSQNPKFILLSTTAASLEQGPKMGFPMTGYGSSKAAANYIASMIANEEPWLLTLMLMPGFVYTDMMIEALGKETANDLNSSGKAISANESAEKMIKLIEEANKEKQQGQFIDASTGELLPW